MGARRVISMNLTTAIWTSRVWIIIPAVPRCITNLSANNNMEHPETHLVTPTYGPRPAGSPDRCFYCDQSVGTEHVLTCVLRSRTVVLRYTFEVVVDVPDAWDADDIESHRNDSSWCADYAVDDLLQRHDEVCWCGNFSAEYLREATADDEEVWQLDLLDK
jgi:hypothetical protein